MNIGIDIFSHEKFSGVRAIKENSRFLFCAADIASALGYKRVSSTISRHCKKAIKRPFETNGGVQAMIFIPENDVFRLITHSELPEAEELESWLFDELLPSIYSTGGSIIDDQKFINTYFPLVNSSTKKMITDQLFALRKQNERRKMEEK